MWFLILKLGHIFHMSKNTFCHTFSFRNIYVSNLLLLLLLLIELFLNMQILGTIFKETRNIIKGEFLKQLL